MTVRALKKLQIVIAQFLAAMKKLKTRIKKGKACSVKRFIWERYSNSILGNFSGYTSKAWLEQKI
jgi:hypothetical protein